jgi:hypothetical protein
MFCFRNISVNTLHKGDDDDDDDDDDNNDNIKSPFYTFVVVLRITKSAGCMAVLFLLNLSAQASRH